MRRETCKNFSSSAISTSENIWFACYTGLVSFLTFSAWLLISKCQMSLCVTNRILLLTIQHVIKLRFNYWKDDWMTVFCCSALHLCKCVANAEVFSQLETTLSRQCPCNYWYHSTHAHPCLTPSMFFHATAVSEYISFAIRVWRR